MATSLSLYKKRTAIILGVCFLVADRLLKALAISGYRKEFFGDWFLFSLSRNNNAALSLPLGFNILWLATPITLCILVWLFVAIKKNKSHQAALLLISIGALSNLYDRIFYGYVIDYVDVLKLNIFNIADVLIICGAALFLFFELAGKEKK